MGLVEQELQDVSKRCEQLIPGSRLVACVRSMVRVEIKCTSTKTIVVCAQFPVNYPQEVLLIELKSKTLSSQLLDNLTAVCEREARKTIGGHQILAVLKFVRSFLEQNPLSCCYDEVKQLKQDVASAQCGADELHLKQKTSTIVLRITQGPYFLRTVINVPDLYPEHPVSLQDVDTNFPPVFKRFFQGQAKEIARQCVEPPLTKKRSQERFVPQPSLLHVVRFLTKQVKSIPGEKCQYCKLDGLPKNPKDAERNESAVMHIERMYCGHIFHQTCLVTYMAEPPFQGGKKCPTCRQRIYHDKWRLSDKLAEDRWAHRQARERELEEVTDFLTT